MELIRGLHNLETRASNGLMQPCVLSIGNFDGVHLGHQMILRQVRRRADGLKLPARVMVFEPQPLEFFEGMGAPARLTPFHQKIRLILSNSIDSVICLHFNEELRGMSAQNFIERVLVRNLNVQFLIVGDDFRFGCKQQGDFEMLREAGMHYGFEVTNAETLSREGQRVSSTRVRGALENSDFALAEKLLERPYTISGRVMHGNRLGSSIGVPTANLSLKGKRPPLSGVFAVEVAGLDRRVGHPLVQGVANVGVRPTVDGTMPLLETHLFDFDEDIYGERISVFFRHKIREEKKFSSVDDLEQQIIRDIASAKRHFGAI